MPTYERYPGEPKARAEARIKRNLAKKKGKRKPAKKEVVQRPRRKRGPARRGRPKKFGEMYV